jgi:hypothetical protein
VIFQKARPKSQKWRYWSPMKWSTGKLRTYKKPASPEVKAEAIALRAQGWTYVAIAKKFDLTQETARRLTSPAAAAKCAEWVRNDYAANPEKYKTRARKWRREHLEHVRERNRKWAADNREYLREYRRAHNDVHREEVRTYQREYKRRIRAAKKAETQS